jgi:hypothetical protein
MRAIGCTEHSISSRAALRRAVVDSRRRGNWRDAWVVIDSLYVANGVTIVVCSSSRGSITLSALASLGAGSFDIARVDLGVAVSGCAGEITRVVAARGLTPMFSLSRLRTGAFFGDRFGTASPPRLKDGSSAEATQSADFVTVSVDDSLVDEW